MKKTVFCALLLILLLPMTAFADASGYTVEFNYGGQEYVLPGDSSVKLSEILHALGLEGTVTEAESGAPELFQVEKDAEGDDWTVTALHAFASREALSITLDGVPHEILVTDTQDPVIFYEYDPNTKELVRQEVFDYYTLVDSSCTSLTLEAGQWYVIDGTVTLQSRVENKSSVGNPAKIILKNGCTLYAPYGIENGSRNSLHIYGQDKNGGNGQLIIHSVTVSVPEGCAGIGGGSSPGENAQGCGYLEINGGILDIYGGKNAAGIGGGDNAADVSVTINAGDVTAHGGEKGAGIGTGYGSTADIRGKGKIIINGGTVEATGGKWGAGIGCGYYGYPNPIEINGGNVTANGGSDGGAGIGGGHNTSGVDTTITGGTVCAIGNNTASGIGLGLNGVAHRSLTITGEQVVIYSGPEMTEATLITADSYVRLRELYVRLSITENPAHEHTFSDEWSKDETNHWHAATCEHTGMTSGFAGHIWGTEDKVNECSVCGYVKPNPAHEHTFSDEWSKDETNHWHAATCGHTDMTSGFAAHTWGTGDKANECTVCGYVKPDPAHEHTFSDEWSKDETNHWHAATCEHTDMTSGFAAHTWGTGDKANECTVCGYVKPDPAHEHTFSDVWSSDETNHWHAATCEHTEIAKGIAAHQFGDDNVCDVCQYVKETPAPAHEHTFSDVWSSDETNHWHAATCEHTEIAKGIAPHQFGDDNVCDVCQYVKKSPVPVDLPLYGIVITTPPNKITYTEGESFNPTGMVVNALYAKPIMNYSLSPFSNLIKTDTAITVSYTENGVTKTAQQPITVGPVKEPYKIIVGANQVVLTTADSAVFSSNADFSKFVRVEVDGKEVPSKYYTAKSGSTVITFSKEYIATLMEGKHTLRIVSNDGSASTGFTVTSIPKTGDSTNPALLLTLLIASMGTLLLMAARTRKRNQD